MSAALTPPGRINSALRQAAAMEAMHASHTALGIERNGKRLALVAGHRDGVQIRVDAGPYAPAEVEHLIALLSEQLTNHRLKTAATEQDHHD